MAEGWLNHYAKKSSQEQILAYSAGILTQPIHPNAIEVMKENDIDVSHHLAESFFTIPINYLTHFITVCD